MRLILCDNALDYAGAAQRVCDNAPDYAGAAQRVCDNAPVTGRVPEWPGTARARAGPTALLTAAALIVSAALPAHTPAATKTPGPGPCRM